MNTKKLTVIQKEYYLIVLQKPRATGKLVT